jgi:hypothetical protein
VCSAGGDCSSTWVQEWAKFLSIGSNFISEDAWHKIFSVTEDPRGVKDEGRRSPGRRQRAGLSPSREPVHSHPPQMVPNLDKSSPSFLLHVHNALFGAACKSTRKDGCTGLPLIHARRGWYVPFCKETSKVWPDPACTDCQL